MVAAIVEPEHVTLPKGMYTYEDYLKLPNDGKRYEIIEGVLYVANAPSFQHQYTVHQIDRQIGNFVTTWERAAKDISSSVARPRVNA